MWDTLIIGAGPAGLSAGAALSRIGHSVLLIERNRFGGRALGLPLIENYPGFPDGISGRELTQRLVKQGRRWNLSTRKAALVSLNGVPGRFQIKLETGNRLWAKTVIFCTGTQFKKLGIPGEELFFGRGVENSSFNGTSLFKRKPVAVAGGGETALWQALTLSTIASQVFLIIRGESFRAHPLLQRRVQENRNISVWRGTAVKEALGTRRLEQIIVQRGPSKRQEALKVSALFILIGQKPDPLAVLHSKEPGIFVAGDASGTRHRQTVVAAADGLRAAMECSSFLEKTGPIRCVEIGKRSPYA